MAASSFRTPTASATGQLTLSQNTIQPLTIQQGTAIVNANGVIYVLDNEPITIASGSAFPAGTYPSQILPFTLGAGGALARGTKRPDSR